VVEVGRDARDHGDAAGREVVEHRGRVDLDDIADATEIDLFAVDHDAAAAAAEEPGVLPAEAGRDRTVRVDLGDELRVHLTGEHHAHDADRLGVRDAVSALELAGDLEPLQHVRDLRAAAVHDDRQHPDVAEIRDVLREGVLQLLRHHGVAAVLDHDDLVAELLEPRQRLDERGGLLRGDLGRSVMDVGHEA
jgi:hypothetical protein